MNTMIEIICVSGFIIFMVVAWRLWVKSGKEGQFMNLDISGLVILSGIFCAGGIVLLSIGLFVEALNGYGMLAIYVGALVMGLDQAMKRMKALKE